MELNFKKNFYVSTESNDFYLNDHLVDLLLTQRRYVYVYHLITKECMWLDPVSIAMGKPKWKDEKQILGYNYKFEGERVTIEPFIKNLLELFHWSWIEAIDLESTWFKNINQAINSRKKTTQVFPELGTFRVFKQPINRIKMVIFGESPYPSHDSFGLAFGTKLGTKPYSLLKFQEAIQEGFNHTIPLQNDLLNWEQQGIFLLNSYLTVDKIDKKFHKEIWKPFIVEVIKVLNKRDLVWLLMGADAKSFKSKIEGTVFECEHPAASAYNDTKIWNHNDIFINGSKILADKGFKIKYV